MDNLYVNACGIMWNRLKYNIPLFSVLDAENEAVVIGALNVTVKCLEALKAVKNEMESADWEIKYHFLGQDMISPLFYTLLEVVFSYLKLREQKSVARDIVEMCHVVLQTLMHGGQ